MTVLFRWPAKVAGAAFAAALVALMLACSSERPSTPMTLTLPSRLTVSATDAGSVFDAVSGFAADAGLAPDAANTAKARGVFTSQKVRCAPGGNERHSAWCVFRFTAAPAQGNATQTEVSVKVIVVERVPYDPQAALRQVSIEPTLDRLVTQFTRRFGAAAVAQTELLTF